MDRNRNERPTINAFTKFMRTLDCVLSKIEDTITISFFIIMIGAILVGVVMRFVLKIPNMYGEEISRYSMIVVAFVGISVGVRQRAHLGIDGVVNNLPPSMAKILKIIAQLVSIFAYGLFTVQTFLFIEQSRRMQQISPSLRLPMWIVYCVLLVGFTLSFIRSLMIFWNDYFAVEDQGLLEPEEDIEQNFQ